MAKGRHDKMMHSLEEIDRENFLPLSQNTRAQGSPVKIAELEDFGPTK